MTMSLSMDMGGQVNTMDMSNKNTNRRTETILAVTAGRPTKFRVAWESYEEEDSSPMGGGGRGGRKRVAPEVNVPYIVEIADSTVSVTREDNGSVPTDLQRFFKNEYGNGSFDSRIGRFLDGKPVALNTPILGTKELVSLFMGRSRGQFEPDVKEFSMTLIGKLNEGGIDCAVFRVKIIVTVNQGPLAMETSLEGDLLIDPARTWPVSLKMEGPIIGSASNSNVSASGDGTMSMSKKATYK
jgi:hypothetical protein